MSDVDGLRNVSDPAWPHVQEWLKAGEVDVEILPPNPAYRDAVLEKVGVSLASALGAVVYESGGLLIDHGWIRVRGCGHPKLPRSVKVDGSLVVVGDDAVGGFFALHPPEGDVRYLAPDTLEWEVLEMKYSAWLRALVSGGMGKFYEAYRSPGWESRLTVLRPDQCFMILPFPWTEGPSYPSRSWKPTSVEEIYGLTLDIQAQLRNGEAGGV